MILDPISAAVAPPRPLPADRRRCNDCPALMRPERSLHIGNDARCGETLYHRIVGSPWQARDAAPWWCPREREA